MRYTLMFGLGGCDDYIEMAKAADDTGWNAISIPDSLFFPKSNSSDYPYSDTEAVRGALEVTPVLEPFIAITQMAMATTNIRFYPGVLKVPVRQPLVLAKTLSSLGVISNNRLLLGAGISPWKEDFTHNGVPFEPRGRMLDECIEIIRGVMTGDYFEFHGEHYDFDLLKMSPVPTKPLPILIGGHSKPALRRAARVGDGWMSANSDFDALVDLIGQLTTLREKYGTAARDDFQVHAMDVTARSLDDYKRLRDIGVTDICVCPWSSYDPTLTAVGRIDGIKRFAETIIPNLG